MKRLMLIAAALTMLASKSNKDAYILAYDENVTFNAGTDFSYFKTLRERYPGKVLWVRRNGREYVVRDETLLLRARALFAPQAALAPEQVAVAREETQLDREEDRLDDAPKTAENERRLSEIRARQKDIARREKALDEREEEVERAAERELWGLVDGAIRTGAAKPVR